MVLGTSQQATAYGSSSGEVPAGTAEGSRWRCSGAQSILRHCIFAGTARVNGDGVGPGIGRSGGGGRRWHEEGKSNIRLKGGVGFTL